MKNLFKYSFVLAASVFFFSSCTDDCDYTPAQAVAENTDGVSFSDLASMDIEVAPTATKEMKLQLKRAALQDAVTVPIIVQRNDEGVFQIPETVSFAAGAQDTELTITFPNAVEGGKYHFEIALGNNALYESEANPIASGSVFCVQWNDLGEGRYLSDFEEVMTGEKSERDVKVLKANHAELYRVINPMDFINTFGKGFTMDIECNGTAANVASQFVFNHPALQLISASGNGMVNNGIITMNLLFECSQGSFGYMTEVLKLPVSAD